MLYLFVTLTRFYQALTWMAAFYALNSIATYIAWMMMTRFNANANNDMRKGLFGKLQRMTIRYFDTHQDGMDYVKKLKKNSEITEDDQKKAEKDLQDLLDKNIKRVDAALAAKEKELMSL